MNGPLSCDCHDKEVTFPGCEFEILDTDGELVATVLMGGNENSYEEAVELVDLFVNAADVRKAAERVLHLLGKLSHIPRAARCTEILEKALGTKGKTDE